MIPTDSPIDVFDPVAVFSAEVDKHPSPAGIAARVMLDVQAQLQRVLFSAPRINSMEFRVLPLRKQKVTMQVIFKVTGRWAKKTIELAIDGRQLDKARIDGHVVDTPLLAHQAALKIAAEVNR